MRALFFIILILNVAYFAWQFIRSPSDMIGDVPSIRDIEPIVLLSEAKAVKEQVEKIRVAEVKAAKEKEAEKVAVNMGGKDSEKPVSGLSKEMVVASTEAVGMAKKSASDALSGEAKIAGRKEGAVLAKNKNKNKNKKQAPLPAQCYTVGPFRDLKKLRGLTRAIKSYVIEADFRGKEERAPPLYWVYTVAEKTKKETLKTAARLRSKKINDFYIINSDKKVNTISLGRFRDKKGVQKFVKKLEKWGFDVIVELIRKKVTIYWLDYKLAAGRSIPKSVFRKFQPSKKQAASRLVRQCDS